MDATIFHWVMVVATAEAVMEGLGLLIRYLAPYFYAENGIVASTQSERLLQTLDVLADLFDQVGIRTNT